MEMTPWCPRFLPLLVLSLGALGCGGRSAGFVVALGSHGTLPTWQGTCAAESARGGALAIDGSSFDALAPGRTTLTCARGELTIDVVDIERIEIEGPETVGRHSVYFRVVAFGDGRELDLGDGFPVTWEHDAALVRDAPCSDGLGTCAGSASIRVHATSGGNAQLSVSLAGKRATRAITLDATH